MDQLSDLLESAPQEEELKAKHSDDCSGCPECEVTDERVEFAASEGLTHMFELCDDPVVHKVAILQIAQNMVLWHSKVGTTNFNNGDEDCGTAWTRDAGKWQAIMDIVMNINLGPNYTWCQHG